MSAFSHLSGKHDFLCLTHIYEKDPFSLMDWSFLSNSFCVLFPERNDQTEQEERREIKQRLNRKVQLHEDPASLLW